MQFALAPRLLQFRTDAIASRADAGAPAVYDQFTKSLFSMGGNKRMMRQHCVFSGYVRFIERLLYWGCLMWCFVLGNRLLLELCLQLWDGSFDEGMVIGALWAASNISEFGIVHDRLSVTYSAHQGYFESKRTVFNGSVFWISGPWFFWTCNCLLLKFSDRMPEARREATSSS